MLWYSYLQQEIIHLFIFIKFDSRKFLYITEYYGYLEISLRESLY